MVKYSLKHTQNNRLDRCGYFKTLSSVVSKSILYIKKIGMKLAYKNIWVAKNIFGFARPARRQPPLHSESIGRHAVWSAAGRARAAVAPRRVTSQHTHIPTHIYTYNYTYLLTYLRISTHRHKTNVNKRPYVYRMS